MVNKLLMSINEKLIGVKNRLLVDKNNVAFYGTVAFSTIADVFVLVTGVC